MIVMKFGGTSVRNKEAIERVISIVRGRVSSRPLVVVSALAKVTRVLCKLAEEAEAQHITESEELLADIRDRHTSLAAELLPEGSGLLSDCFREINSVCDSLSEFIKGVCCIGELSPRSYARIVSTGEILSSIIVSAAMNASGLGCRWLDARKMIVTDCAYMAAKPDLAATESNVRRLVPEAFKGVSVVLTQGFIASSEEGSPSVLGFEGSDYSAAIFGMATGAERVEIWTDVDGIQTADPRIVESTFRVPVISYEEASEMAFLGARVLHPLTIEPARKRNIPVIVLNSMAPDSPGTAVFQDYEGSGPKTVAIKDDIDYLEITSSQIIGVSAMLSAIFDAMSGCSMKSILVSVSESRAGITMESSQQGLEALLACLRKHFEVLLYRDKAQISVVGRNTVITDGVIGKILEAVGERRIYMTSQSPVLLSTSIVVDRNDSAAILRDIHTMLFEQK